MPYFVYILESDSTGHWYYGFSEDADQRVSDHKTNRSKHTRFKGPWRLIFKREFADKTEALKFERYLKKSRNKEFIRRKFSESFVA
jgi:putative endonuclease